MGHALHTRRYSGMLLVALTLPCTEEAFEAFAKEVRRGRENNESSVVVNHDEGISFVFKKGHVEVSKAEFKNGVVKSVVYNDAFVGVHDIFGLEPIGSSDIQTSFSDDLTAGSGDSIEGNKAREAV